jgi:prevent-host-death family protein
MKTVAFTDFREHASELFSEVEAGGRLLVLRHGKPIAEISPASEAKSDVPLWRKPGLRLVVRGHGLSDAIVEERRGEDIP